jgi:cell wall-associated NlpC family hydrolase
MCSSVAVGKPINTQTRQTPIFIEYKGALADFMASGEQEITLIQHQVLVHKEREEQKRLKKRELNKNSSDLKVAIANTQQYVDKTWYVFSGSTPQGWDCSGLVAWTFAHMGFELYHSATAQMHTGKTVYVPKFGDIVGFAYHGSKAYYHVGIYISEDLMLHSGGKRGDKTELRAISSFGGNYSRVAYSRLIDTN